MTDPRRKGIETVYHGIRFRSRLEAKWAVTFDLLNIPWRYEPMDLREYIPDYLLPFAKRPLLVEIRPEQFQKEAMRSIDSSGWDGDAAVIGDFTFASSPVNLGFFRQDGEWHPECCSATCRSCRRAFIYPLGAWWICPNCGLASVEGVRQPCVPADDEFGAAWSSASNSTRWVPVEPLVSQ
jgi:hypothetical protein